MHSSSQSDNEKRKIIKGISWLLMLNWSNRLLGFFSIIILARILTPEDFGVMAIIMMALQLTDTLTNLGSEQYYIQKNDAKQADLNCAWSMNLLLKIFTSVCFAIIAPLVATHFNYAEIIPALLTIAFLPSINALSNGTFYRYKKELNYQTFVTLSAGAKLIGNCLAIIFALVLQNYWALLIGAMVNAIIFLLGSYIFLPEKCRFEFTQWHSQLQFSKWMMLKNLVGHLRAKVDSWFTAHLFGVTTLGGYNFSKDLVLLPSRELLSPITEVFFTAIAKTELDSQEQNLKIRKSLAIIFSIAFPIALGWQLISSAFVQLILGEQWLPYTDIISLLGLLVVTFSVGNFISQVMTATGHVKQLFHYDVVTLAFTLLTFYGFSSVIYSIELLAQYRVMIGIGIVTIGFFWLASLRLVSILHVVKSALLPLLLSLLMVEFVGLFAFSQYSQFFELGLSIITAILFYAVSFYIGCKYQLLGHIESKFIATLISDSFNKTLTKISKK